MGDHIISLSEEQEKAILWDVVMPIQEYLQYHIDEKARRCTDEICRLALEDQTHTILTLDEKKQLRDYLDAQGIIITSLKQLPLAVKTQILAAARIKSAAERQAEAEGA